MKKYTPLILASMMVLAGCGPTPAKPEDKTVDRLVNRTIYSWDFEEQKIKSESIEVFFKANSEIPYINIGHGAQIYEAIRKAKRGATAKITTEVEGKKATIKNDANATCVLDAEAQTIYFPDYDAFFHNDKTDTPLSLLDTTHFKSIVVSKDHPKQYNKGQPVTIDLKPYSLIDIYQSGDNLYLPVQAFSDLFLSANDAMDLAYNMQDFFFVNVVSPLEVELGPLKDLNDYGEKFYSGPKSNTVSEQYADFNYQSILLNLDYTYGMKKAKGINSFDEYFNTKGYKNDMKSTDVHTLDNSFAYALSSLVDFHTAKSGTTPLYGYEDGNADESKLDPAWTTFSNGSTNLQKAKRAAIQKGDMKDGFEIDSASGTAFISFNDFTDVNEDLLYMPEELRPEDYPSLVKANTQTLFNDAYKQITSAENKDKVKYVVVDLSTNDGGSISSLIYGLCTLLGEVHISQMNPLSGASSTTYFKADINGDEKVDANDKSLSELGYKIVFLDSKYSFSSANAMPVFAKDNNSKVTILGEKTAGGPCAIRNTFTPVGSRYSQSSLTTLAKKQADKYVDIDSGIAPDVDVQEENMFNHLFLGSQMSVWTDR